jgi:hypothetical protein
MGKYVFRKNAVNPPENGFEVGRIPFKVYNAK